MKLVECGKVLTEEILAKFEEKLNVILPNSYKEFMLKNNGGTPEEEYVFDFFDIAGNFENNSCIRSFFIINEEETNGYDDLLKIYRIMKEEVMIAENVLPIADDPAGNPICMNLGEDRYGTIYLADSELEDPLTGQLLLNEIAASFSEFFDKLYIV